MATIYLAGHSIEFEYREYCIKKYGEKHKLIDPMASGRVLDRYGQEDLKKHEKLKHEEIIPNEVVDEIIKGDKHDINRSDIVLAYVKKPTFGTVMEIMYAYMSGKPVITVNPEGNWTGDIWLRKHSKVILSTLDEAFKLIDKMEKEKS